MRLSVSVSPELFQLPLPDSCFKLWLWLDATVGLSKSDPTQRQIARALKLSVATVQSSIDKLVAFGALAVLSSAGRWGTDRYVTIRWWEKVDLGVTDLDRRAIDAWNALASRGI